MKGLAILFALALAGCASGPAEPPKTGSVRVIDGVEVWEHGVPSRAYHVVGTVRQVAANNSTSSNDQIASVVQTARHRKADGVIVLDAVQVVSRVGYGMSSRSIMAPKIEAQLIRYQ